MLVLTRRIEEVLVIGDDIEVVVLDSRGGQVRLGISAPKSTPVHRKEIYDRLLQEQNKAISFAASNPPAIAASE